MGGGGAGDEEARAEADLAERAAGLGGAIAAIGAQFEPAGADEALDAGLAEHLLLIGGGVVEDDLGALAGAGEGVGLGRDQQCIRSSKGRGARGVLHEAAQRLAPYLAG